MWDVNNSSVPKRVSGNHAGGSRIFRRWKEKVREEMLDDYENFKQKENQFGGNLMKNKAMLFSMILIIATIIIGFGGRVEAATCGACNRPLVVTYSDITSSSHQVNYTCGKCNVTAVTLEGHYPAFFENLGASGHKRTCVCGYVMSSSSPHSMVYVAKNDTECQGDCKYCAYQIIQNHNFVDDICTYCGYEKGYISPISDKSDDETEICIVKNERSTALTVTITATGISKSDSGTPRQLKFTDSIPAGVTRAYIHYKTDFTSAPIYVGYYDISGSTAGASGTLAMIGMYDSLNSDANSRLDANQTYSVSIPSSPTTYNTWVAASGTSRSIARTLPSYAYLYCALNSNGYDYIYDGVRGATDGVTVASTEGKYEYGQIILTYEDPHQHNWTTTYETTETTHTPVRTCSSCSKEETDSTENHTWLDDHKCKICGYSCLHNYGSYATITEPTCEEQGYKQKACTICGATDGETIAALGHINGAAATCTTPQTCTRCGAIIWNAVGHSFTTKDTSSTYLKSSATCTEAAVYYYRCSREGCTAKGTETYTYGDALGHTSSSWKMDETNHWKVCTVCGATTYNKENHKDSNSDGKCDTCGYGVQISASISYATTKVSKAYGDLAFVNPLTNTGDGTVKYTSSNANVATVDSSTGKVTIVGVGNATITATVEDTAQYVYATKTAKYDLTVSKATINPTVSMSDYTYGGTKSTPTISGNSGNGTVTYYYNTTNSNGGGTLWSNVTSSTSLNAGTYYMYATVAETTNYKGTTTATAEFKVKQAAGYITLSPMSVSLPYGTSSTSINVTAYHSGATLDAEQTTTTVATVGISGTTVTVSNLSTLAINTSVTIKVTAGASKNYTEASAVCTVTIGSKATINPTVSMSDYTYGGTKAEPTISGNTGNGTETYYYNTTNSNSGGTPWSNVTSSTYLNVGKYYMYAVVGETTNYKGATTAPVEFNVISSEISGSVTIKGTNTYGQTLSLDTSAIEPSDCTLKYQWWYSESSTATSGTNINGATSKTYTIESGLVGKYIGVTVTATRTNYTTKTFTDITDATNNKTATVSKATINPTVGMSNYTYGGTKSTPTISGNTGNGTETYYYNTTNSNSGGTPWSNVTSSTYLNVGKYYMYAVVGETTNYKGATTAPVEFNVISSEISGSVTIKGTNTYGQTLSLDTSAINPSDCTLTYQWWYSTSSTATSGTIINGATSKTYTIGSGLVGKYIGVTVIATRTNYTTNTFVDITDGSNVTATVDKATLDVPKLENKDDYIYNGEEQTANVTGVDDNTMQIDNNKRKDAGTENITISLKDPENYKWKDGSTEKKEIPWTIKKYDLSNATIGTIEEFVYDGKEKKPTPTVTVPIPKGTNTTLGAEDFEYSYSNNINASKEAKLIVTAKSTSKNYTGSTSKKFEISRADATITITSSANQSVMENETINVTYSYNGDGTVTAKSSDKNIAISSVDSTKNQIIVTGKNAGKVKITVTASQGTNYNEASTEFEVTVIASNYMIKRNSEENYYETLQQAFDAALTLETVVVRKDVSAEKSAQVPTNKTVTLDTGSHYITLAENAGIEIPTTSKLIICGNGTIKKTANPSTTLILNKGTLEVNGTPTLTNIYNYVLDNLGTATFTGGTVRGAKPIHVRGEASSEVIVNGSNVNIIAENYMEAEHGAITLEGNSKLEFVNGNVTANGNISAVRGVLVKGNATATISGGTISATSTSATNQGDAIGVFTTGEVTIKSENLLTGSRAGVALLDGNTGNVNIFGGTIVGGQVGILNNSTAKVTIGNKADDVVITTKPIIRGEKIAYISLKATSKLEFYDGVLQSAGRKNVIYQDVIDISSNVISDLNINQIEANVKNTHKLYFATGTIEPVYQEGYDIHLSTQVINGKTYDIGYLRVYTAPIVNGPQNVTLRIGESTTFTITVIGGVPSKYTFKWQTSIDGGKKWTDIVGETSDSYKTPIATADMDGNMYRCIVSNGIFNVKSREVTLTIDEKDLYEFPVDIVPIGRFTFISDNVISTVNGKDAVELELVVKSTSPLKYLKLNNENIDLTKNEAQNILNATIKKTKYVEIKNTVGEVAEYAYSFYVVVSKNGIYTAEFKDDNGYSSNVTQTIDTFNTEALTVEYSVQEPTLYRKYSVVTFIANRDVKFVSPEAFESQMTKNSSNEYVKKYTLNVYSDLTDVTFSFKDKSGYMASVKVSTTQSVSKNVRFTSDNTSLGALSINDAYVLSKNLSGKVELGEDNKLQYRYGISSTQSDMFMSRARDVGAAVMLSNATTAKSYDAVLPQNIEGIGTSKLSRYGISKIENEYVAAFNANATGTTLSMANAKYVDILKGARLNLYKGLTITDFNIGSTASPYVMMSSENTGSNVDNTASSNSSFRVTIINK